MIVVLIVVCYVTSIVCVSTVMCSEKRLKHQYEMAKLKAAQERLLLGAGEPSKTAPWETTYGAEG